MKIIVSPAKSLNFDCSFPKFTPSQPVFLDEAAQLMDDLRQKKPAQLKSLMHISDKLAELNWTRNQSFTTPFTTDNARPAVYTFDGDVYSGLDVQTLPEEKIPLMQKRLRILSGLYGLLKPLDLMQAYRLEMGTSFGIGKAKNLYAFWQSKLTDKLNEELNDQSVLVNLASQEYFKAIDSHSIKAPVVSPVFKDFKNGKLKIISFFAKKARGRMARYILDNNIETAEGLLGFDYDGYLFSEAETLDPLAPVFIR